jgi:hypothetical protein
MDADKLVICSEEDFVEHRNALDVVNFERLEELIDDDHLVIPTGKPFWESLNLVLCILWKVLTGIIGCVRTSAKETMDVCSRLTNSTFSVV